MKGYFEIIPIKIKLADKNYKVEAYYNNGQAIKDVDAYRVKYCNGLVTVEIVEDWDIKDEIIKVLGRKLQ